MAITKKELGQSTPRGRAATRIARLLKSGKASAFTTTDVMAETGLSRTETQQALKTLTESGAVEYKPFGEVMYWAWK